MSTDSTHHIGDDPWADTVPAATVESHDALDREFDELTARHPLPEPGSGRWWVDSDERDSEECGGAGPADPATAAAYRAHLDAFLTDAACQDAARPVDPDEGYHVHRPHNAAPSDGRLVCPWAEVDAVDRARQAVGAVPDTAVPDTAGAATATASAALGRPEIELDDNPDWDLAYDAYYWSPSVEEDLSRAALPGPDDAAGWAW